MPRRGGLAGQARYSAIPGPPTGSTLDRIPRLIAGLTGSAAAVFYRVDRHGPPLPDGPVIVAANHPNSLVDPLLIFRCSERITRPLGRAPLIRSSTAGTGPAGSRSDSRLPQAGRSGRDAPQRGDVQGGDRRAPGRGRAPDLSGGKKPLRDPAGRVSHGRRAHRAAGGGERRLAARRVDRPRGNHLLAQGAGRGRR